MYAYCGNNPVNREDNGGNLWDVVFDIASIAYSAYQVCKEPTNLWNWVGLAADAVSLVIPGVTGGCAAVRAFTKADDIIDATRAVSKVDDVADVAKVVKKVDDTYDGAQVASDFNKIQDTFLPDEYYSNIKAPRQSTPNSSYTSYKFNDYTQKFEKSTAYYDSAGRQSIRIDYTNHGYSNHGNPHIHFTYYNGQFPFGKTIRWD